METDANRAPREADQAPTAAASAAPAPGQEPLGTDNTAQKLGTRPGERLIVEEIRNLLVRLHEQNQLLDSHPTLELGDGLGSGGPDESAS